MAHERAAIMALTFTIGFTTGLIAFGLPVKDVPLAYVAPVTQTASVVNAKSDVGVPVITERTASPAEQTSNALVELDETGLYLLDARGERELVSIARGVEPALNDTAHIAIHQPLLSPDGQYLFYCSEGVAMEGTCDALVYSVAENTLHPVTVPTLQIPSSLRVAWASDGRLQINQQVSVSADRPWMVQ